MLIDTSRPMVCVADGVAYTLGHALENAVADGSAVQEPVVFHSYASWTCVMRAAAPVGLRSSSVKVLPILFVLCADGLDHIGVGRQGLSKADRKGLRVRARVLEGHLDVNVAEVTAREALDNV